MPDDKTDPARSSERAAFALLGSGVPLSLLLDLAGPVRSDELMRDERADTSWVPPRPRASGPAAVRPASQPAGSSARPAR